MCGLPRYDQDFADYLRDGGFRVFDMNEAHRQDHATFNLCLEDYKRRYWIGHYGPAGNRFFAYSLKNVVVDWLEPKPRTYLGEGISGESRFRAPTSPATCPTLRRPNPFSCNSIAVAARNPVTLRSKCHLSL